MIMIIGVISWSKAFLKLFDVGVRRAFRVDTCKLCKHVVLPYRDFKTRGLVPAVSVPASLVKMPADLNLFEWPVQLARL